MKKILQMGIFCFLLLSACGPVTKTAMVNRRIFYAGESNGVKTALLKAGYTLVDDFDKAEVFVLNGEIPDVNLIASKLQGGAGLVLITGKGMSFRDLEVLFKYPVTELIPIERPAKLVADEIYGKSDPLITEINWNDAPQIRERAFIMTSAPGKQFVRIDGFVEVFLGAIGQDAERKFAIDAYLDEQHNLQFQKWKYFNYLIYHLVERAAGAIPMTYADYSAQIK